MNGSRQSKEKTCRGARDRNVLIPPTMRTLRLHCNRMLWSPATGLNWVVVICPDRPQFVPILPNHIWNFIFNDSEHATMEKKRSFMDTNAWKSLSLSRNLFINSQKSLEYGNLIFKKTILCLITTEKLIDKHAITQGYMNQTFVATNRQKLKDRPVSMHYGNGHKKWWSWRHQSLAIFTCPQKSVWN